MELHEISKRFKRFAVAECRGSSVLYERLAEKVAKDEELLQIASCARRGQPIPNLLFGAVHYLLLRGRDHELSRFYPSLVEMPMDASGAFPDFKNFCLSYKDEVISILESRLVQTNEVRRCVYLYPAFCYIYHLVKKPLALIEIGTSAGLQLLWDRYGYDYGSNGMYGDTRSELTLGSQIQGDRAPILSDQSPPVARRIGIDLHINDVTEFDHLLWLKALIWPEHTERISNLEKAARIRKKMSLELIEGDGVEKLPEIASTIGHDSIICVFHTHVANQIPEEEKYKLEARIRELGGTRDVFHLYNNMWDTNKLHLDYYLDRNETNITLAETDGHGRWFTWNV